AMAHDVVAWSVAEAKARLSELIDRALSDGPQVITRKGRRTVVVVSAEEWERKTQRAGNLAELFAGSPLRGSRIAIARATAGPRVAEAWRAAMARSQRRGAGLGSMDAFLAATAAAHRLTLVTRNIRDFAVTGVALVDPWVRPS